MNISRHNSIPPIIADGIKIRIDLDNTRKVRKPAIKQNVAVRVPDANICQITNKPVIKKKILSFFIFVVIEMIINAMAALAA